MTPDEFRAALAQIEVNVLRLGRALGVNTRTAQRWATDGPSPPVAGLLRLCVGLGMKWGQIEPLLQKNASQT